MNLAIAQAAQSYARIEGAGVFWLAAELAILVLVRAGRRHLETIPLPTGFRITRQELPLILLSIVALSGLLVLFALRHGTNTLPLDQPIEALAARAAHAERVHLAIWSGFVVGWVVLEALIVYHGWRGYQQLRRLLQPGSAS